MRRRSASVQSKLPLRHEASAAAAAAAATAAEANEQCKIYVPATDARARAQFVGSSRRSRARAHRRAPMIVDVDDEAKKARASERERARVSSSDGDAQKQSRRRAQSGGGDDGKLLFFFFICSLVDADAARLRKTNATSCARSQLQAINRSIGRLSRSFSSIVVVVMKRFWVLAALVLVVALEARGERRKDRALSSIWQLPSCLQPLPTSCPLQRSRSTRVFSTSRAFEVKFIGIEKMRAR